MHTLLSADDARSELENGRSAQPYYVAQEQALPLAHLSDRQFEVLAHLLLEADSLNQDDYDSSLLLAYGADEGRDVVLYQGELPVGVVQCKRYASSIGMGDVLKELFKFLLFALRDPSLMPQAKDFRYEFWTARELTKEAGKFFKEPRRYFDEHASTLGEHVAAARKACKSLQQPSVHGTSPEEEARQAMEIARGLRFAHIGQKEISRRLLTHTQVRRWFFRGSVDAPSSPSTTQVEALVEQLARQSTDHHTRSGNLGSGTYVPSTVVAHDFTRFLESGERLFVLTGGSGHGKTTWAAHLLVSPPPGWKVLLIKGEDIAATDVHVAETLSRLLRAHAIPEELTGADMTAAVWRWLDCANRLLVVDGLDRVSAQVRDRVPTWIQDSLVALARYPSRLVLTSRNEEWRRISNCMAHLVPQPCYLGLLSDEDAANLYRAYGLPPVHHQRPLRTPSLIRRLSELKVELGGTVTRARLLERSINRRKDVLAYTFGEFAVERAFVELSRALAEVPDVRVRASDFQNDTTLRILDALQREDVLVSLPDKLPRKASNGLRPESDDVAEYLIALELDCLEALDAVAGGRTDPIFMGAIAIAPQLSGREPELAPLLEAVLARIHEGMGTWYELAARIMIEVEDHRGHLPVLRRIFDAWKWSNFALLASNLHELMDDLRLPLEERFDLLMRIAHLEETDDWRWKFWVYPDEPGRMVTPFARMMCETVRSQPVECLRLLEELLGRSLDDVRRAVASALLFEAAAVALPETLLSCMRLGEVGYELRANLAYLYPLGFLQHALRCVRVSVAAIDDVVDHFCKAFLRVTTEAGQESVAVGAAIVDELLTLASPGRARLRLLLCSLTVRPDRNHLDELFGSLHTLHWSDIWWLVKVAGADADVPLRAVFSGKLDQHVPYGRLARLDPWAVPPEHWPLVATLLAEFIDAPDRRARRAASEALEMILRKLEQEPQHEGLYLAFMAIALKLAADPEGNVRTPLLYYGAGTKARRPQPAYVESCRADLVAVLVEAEDGTTLDILRQKFHEADPSDPRIASMLRELAQRFGQPDGLTQSLYDLLADAGKRNRND